MLSASSSTRCTRFRLRSPKAFCGLSVHPCTPEGESSTWARAAALLAVTQTERGGRGSGGLLCLSTGRPFGWNGFRVDRGRVHTCGSQAEGEVLSPAPVSGCTGAGGGAGHCAEDVSSVGSAGAGVLGSGMDSTGASSHRKISAETRAKSRTHGAGVSGRMSPVLALASGGNDPRRHRRCTSVGESDGRGGRTGACIALRRRMDTARGFKRWP